MSFDRGTAHFTTQTGEHSLRALVARDEVDRQRGLLGVTEWQGDVAMVVVFPPPWRAAVTMEGMSIALDVAFVLPTGEVDSVYESLSPWSPIVYPVAGISAYAVEMPVGTIRRLRIRRGSGFELREG